jgi:hypothetical protein
MTKVLFNPSSHFERYNGGDWATDLWNAIETYLDSTDWVSKLLLLDSQLASL